MNDNYQGNQNDQGDNFKQNAENFKREASEKIEQFADVAKKEGGPLLSKFMSFDTMISTKIIKVLYVLAMISVILSALAMMVNKMFFQGLGTLIIGPLFVRVYAELMIVLFNINENLAEIKREIKRK